MIGVTKERDAGKRGQAVHQLVLESWVASLCCGRLSLPALPAATAHGCDGDIADGEPCLREIAHLQIAGGRGAPLILVGTQPGSTALLSTSGQTRTRVSASAVTWSLLSEYACAAFQDRLVR